MDVRNIGALGGSQAIRTVSSAAPFQPTAEARPISPKDELQLSSASTISSPKDVESAFRSQRLAQIQQQIADGTYETPEKLERAVDRLLERLLAE